MSPRRYQLRPNTPPPSRIADEFIIFISKVVYLELSQPHGNKDIVKGMFDRVDDDHSGEICVEELCTYLRIYFKDMSVDDTYALIGDFGIDEDGSGNLDLEEFGKGRRRFPSKPSNRELRPSGHLQQVHARVALESRKTVAPHTYLQPKKL